jgi:hypothetical protein
MRGNKAKLGDERTSKNGYVYVKTTTGWELKHRLAAEKVIGRKLADNERVTFKDGNRDNLMPDNLVVSIIKGKSSKAKRARLEAKIEELQAELETLDAEEAV